MDVSRGKNICKEHFLFPAVVRLCRNIVFRTPSPYAHAAAAAVYDLCLPLFQLCLPFQFTRAHLPRHLLK